MAIAESDIVRVNHLVQQSIERRKQIGAEITEAHSITHLKNVAALTTLVGTIYGYSDRALLTSYIGGSLHDLIREPSEDPEVGDELASAQAAIKLLEQEHERKTLTTTAAEREAVVYAIANHGKLPQWLNSPSFKERVPNSINEQTRFALFVADKVEQNGARVIARRSSFVAGDRLQKEGDWQSFGFTPHNPQYPGDELTVVTIESILRLAFINPEGIYPKKLSPLVHPLYEVQRAFVVGVCQAAGQDIDSLARLLLERRRESDGKSILQTRKIETPLDTQSLAIQLSKRSGITNEATSAAGTDLVSSARETVYYFASHYKQNLESVIDQWQPQGDAARLWRQAMLDYQSGVWLKQTRAQILGDKYGQTD